MNVLFNIKVFIYFIFIITFISLLVFFFAFFAIIALPLIILLFLLRKSIARYLLKKNFFQSTYSFTDKKNEDYKYESYKSIIEVDYEKKSEEEIKD